MSARADARTRSFRRWELALALRVALGAALAVGAALASALGIALATGAALAEAPSAGEPGESRVLEDAIASYQAALETPERALRAEGFRRAERLFARVVEAGASNPELYTNLGNAALQAEHLGAAVLAYRRALALDPDHPRALQNLEYARTLLPSWVPKPEPRGLLDSFFFWHATLARAHRALVAAGAFAVAALLIAGSIRFAAPALRTAALLPALVWLALVASLVLEARSGARDEAVVIADETVARAADSALAPSALPAPLPGGAELRILERRSPWIRIRLANGRDAWVAESALMTIEPAGVAAADRARDG